MKKLINVILPSLILLIANFSHAGEWIETGSLGAARQYNTITLLNNGKVLAVGGVTNANGGSTLSSCEIYNPDTGKWTETGTLNFHRSQHDAVLLASGKVLVIGGNHLSSSIGTCELFDPETETWKTTGNLNSPRYDSTAIKLVNGKVLVVGGKLNSNNFLDSCELYDPENGSWVSTGNIDAARVFHQTTLLKNGKVLLSGGMKSDTTRLSNCQIYNPETGNWQSVSELNTSREGHQATLLTSGKVLISGGSKVGFLSSCEIFDPDNNSWTETGSMSIIRTGHAKLLLSNGKVLCIAGDSEGSKAVASCEIFDPESGSWSSTSFLNNKRGTFEALLLKANQILVTGGDADGPILSSAELLTLNSQPQVNISASPKELKVGESVSFSTEASDPDGDTLTYAWNFGDGTDSFEQNPTHTYSTAGTYTATVTITDTSSNTATASVTITVSQGDTGNTGNPPTARFTTSTVVGFVNVPLTFDGTLSTDPENKIASYSWDFGDESPAGTDKTISKVYSTIGSYTVKLTVTDGEGQTNTASRQIEVLSEEAAGSFNAKVEFNVRLNFKKENKDSFKLVANVNVGTQEVASGTTVKVEFAGSTFTGELDTKLQDKSDKNEKWKVKANTTKQTTGGVKLKLKVKKANLAAGFQEAGVTVGVDPKEEFELELPIIITIGDRTIETTLDSTFKFNKKATKAKGSGELE